MEAVLRGTIYQRRRWITFGVMALILIAGQGIWLVHDSLFLATVVLAAGLFWSTPGRRVWPVALPILAAGIAWSSIDPMECSAWWRGRLFYEKAVGHLPYIPWGEIGHKSFSGCASFYQSEMAVKRQMQLVETKTLNGHTLELYQTPMGPYWIPAPGKNLLTWLTWELTMQHDYETAGVAVHPGDIVVDGGAHIGTFTRYALRKGAALVIAIEPESTNLACLEANLAAEIADGRVKVIKAGIWDRRTLLTLADSKDNSAGHSFVRDVPDSTKVSGLPVVPLDDIVAVMKLNRVDFIKMDIEGAERHALAGSSETLRRFKPRMAISSYHMHDDPSVIPLVVAAAQPGYRIYAKDYEDGPRRLITKVLFFE